MTLRTVPLRAVPSADRYPIAAVPRSGIDTDGSGWGYPSASSARFEPPTASIYPENINTSPS